MPDDTAPAAPAAPVQQQPPAPPTFSDQLKAAVAEAEASHQALAAANAALDAVTASHEQAVAAQSAAQVRRNTAVDALKAVADAT